MTQPLELMPVCQADDRFYNYCLWEYEPLTEPLGKYRAATLLFHSFAVARAHDNAYRIVSLIQDAFGTGKTVWGVKYCDGALKWEYYVYDYRRRERERSMTRLVTALEPLITCTVPLNEYPHYFMFSVDIDQQLLTGNRPLDEIHLYVGNVGSKVSSGVSYSLSNSAVTLENQYYFFNPQEQWNDMAGKICCSAFLDAGLIDIDSVLWPELLPCQTVCLANKRHNDCVYFSGITVEQLLIAMKRLAYPPALTGFIEENRSRLDHLRYDFGVDYTLREGKMVPVKSGYYGTF